MVSMVYVVLGVWYVKTLPAPVYVDVRKVLMYQEKKHVGHAKVNIH